MSTCAHCGRGTDGTGGDDGADHARCERMLAMEPPRFCTACGRRMKVQVHPRGWSADCVEHGTLTG